MVFERAGSIRLSGFRILAQVDMLDGRFGTWLPVARIDPIDAIAWGKEDSFGVGRRAVKPTAFDFEGC